MPDGAPCIEVNFPVPLRDDFVAKVSIPSDLTKEEAEKICRVVMALAGQTTHVSGETSSKRCHVRSRPS